MKKKSPIRKCRSARAFEKARIEVALGYCPKIYPCQECGWPVIDGYCCNSCGSSHPKGEYRDADDVPWPVSLNYKRRVTRVA